MDFWILPAMEDIYYGQSLDNIHDLAYYGPVFLKAGLSLFNYSWMIGR